MYISLWIDCLFEIRKIAVCFLGNSLPGHYRFTDEGFFSRNYVVWPIFFLMNVFIALKGTHFLFLFAVGLINYKAADHLRFGIPCQTNHLAFLSYHMVINSYNCAISFVVVFRFISVVKIQLLFVFAEHWKVNSGPAGAFGNSHRSTRVLFFLPGPFLKPWRFN